MYNEDSYNGQSSINGWLFWIIVFAVVGIVSTTYNNYQKNNTKTSYKSTCVVEADEYGFYDPYDCYEESDYENDYDYDISTRL